MKPYFGFFLLAIGCLVIGEIVVRECVIRRPAENADFELKRHESDPVPSDTPSVAIGDGIIAVPGTIVLGPVIFGHRSWSNSTVAPSNLLITTDTNLGTITIKFKQWK